MHCCFIARSRARLPLSLQVSTSTTSSLSFALSRLLLLLLLFFTIIITYYDNKIIKKYFLHHRLHCGHRRRRRHLPRLFLKLKPNTHTHIFRMNFISQTNYFSFYLSRIEWNYCSATNDRNVVFFHVSRAATQPGRHRRNDEVREKKKTHTHT